MQIRVAQVNEDIPWTAAAIIQQLKFYCAGMGRKHIAFEIPEIPQSVNHQYTHTRFNTRLTAKAKSFRAIVQSAMGPLRWEWRPTGVTAAVLVYVSPHWITKEHKIRKMDADNRVKPVFDAVERATQIPDERHWEFHVYKAVGKREHVKVFLFDLGDVVTYYQK